jgi:hypothetical protein
MLDGKEGSCGYWWYVWERMYKITIGYRYGEHKKKYEG